MCDKSSLLIDKLPFGYYEFKGYNNMAWNWDSKVSIENLLLSGRPRRRAPFPAKA
jgi:hypothetical protein